ncbi:MAG: hypothetical protein LBU28_01275 [Spirochaetaceae bacterium]|jgi:hypothetical protein|nr:hypothetical protein [Spirochaetaceae bacterium]
MEKKNPDGPAQFWREYEERYGENVHAYVLGRYLSGWEEYEGPLWGLLIATGGGFRFHHFPHESWLTALSRVARGDKGPEEKTIFIPRDRICSAELYREKSLLKRILLASPPLLILRYRKEAGEGETATLRAETEEKAAALLPFLHPNA